MCHSNKCDFKTNSILSIEDGDDMEIRCRKVFHNHWINERKVEAPKFKFVKPERKYGVSKVLCNEVRRIGATHVGSCVKGRQCRRDYRRELSEDKDYIRWDDSKHNKLRSGDLFVFIDARNGVDGALMKIHRVEGIISRRSQWSNDGYVDGVVNDTSCRNGLKLSKVPVKVVKWSEYKEDVKYGGVIRGTTYIKKSNLI